MENFVEPFNPKPRKPKKVRETGRGGIEQTGRQHVRAKGGESFKWVSPGTNGVPDQIELYGAEAVAETLKSIFGVITKADDTTWMNIAKAVLEAGIQFTEYKAPGKEPTPHQLRMHERLRARGFTVNVIDYKRKDES